MEFQFSVEKLEYFLLIVTRLSAFIMSAPFFSQNTIPVRVKAGISVVLSYVVFMTLDYQELAYTGVIGFAGLVVKEAVAGLLIGYAANICTMILAFSGQLVDMEIGFSMVQEMNPAANFQSTITGNLYTNTVMIIMLVTDLHLFLLSAIIDTFKLIPLGKITIPVNIYTIMTKFMTDYFLIAFRIVLPVFMCILMTNVILAILAKVAPQMNMFVIGMQLKVLVGLAVLVITAGLMPAISDFIFREMKEMMRLFISAMGG